MKPLIKVLLLMQLSTITLHAQTAVLDTYVNEGLGGNLALSTKQFEAEKARTALKEAKAYFMPSVNLLGDYTIADGGRKIDFPIGDLMNPVYQSLNLLLQTKAFPQIQNQSIQFLPNDFHDTRLRTSMPLFQAEIIANRDIQKEGINAKAVEIDIFKRELKKEIQLAYFNYLRAGRAINMYRNADKLLRENKSLTEKLVANHIVLKTALLKIDADISKNDANLAEVINQHKIAGQYLNFLLNKPFDTVIVEDSSLFSVNHAWQQIPSEMINGSQREEQELLRVGIRQTEGLIKLRQGGSLPQVVAFMDLGFQGFGYKFDNRQSYYLGGFNLKWNLFTGFQQRHKIEQARNDKKILETKLEEAKRQLALAASQADVNLRTAFSRCESNRRLITASDELYRLTKSRYMEGQALSIELSDAFTQLINSRLAYDLSLLDVLVKRAELERAR
jgi:outer membrane protein TolC